MTDANPPAEIQPHPRAFTLERLRMLRARVAALRPSQFNMNLWIGHRDKYGLMQRATDYDATYAVPEQTDCGTVGCLGGWALIMFDPGRAVSNRTADRFAADALGLAKDEARRLFFTESWPAAFEERYDYGDPDGRLDLTLERLDAFIRSIETGEPEPPRLLDIEDDA